MSGIVKLFGLGHRCKRIRVARRNAESAQTVPRKKGTIPMRRQTERRMREEAVLVILDLCVFLDFIGLS